MSEIKTQPIDKSTWRDGPWKTETDRKEWRHAGFPCLIVRVPSHGALCGYVGVPPGHPWHGKNYNDVDANAHGGLTYSESCRGAVCHVPAPGEPDDVWWLGFDHAHAGDLCPGYNSMRMFGEGDGDDYRDMDYATRGCESLAEQAATVVGDTPSRN